MKKLLLSTLGTAAILLTVQPSVSAVYDGDGFDGAFGKMVGIAQVGKPNARIMMNVSCYPEGPSRMLVKQRAKIFILTDIEYVECYGNDGVIIMEGCGYGLLRNRGFHEVHACWYIEDVENPRGVGQDYVWFGTDDEDGIEAEGLIKRGNLRYLPPEPEFNNGEEAF